MRKLISRTIGIPMLDISKDLRVGKYLKFYRKSFKWTNDEIKEYQFEKLKKLISYSYQNIEYYRNLFWNYDFSPDNFKSIDDLARLPVLNRSDIQNQYTILINQKYDLRKCYHGVSSGSTGKPVKYLHDKESSSATQAAVYFGWELAGWKLGDRGLHVWGNPNTVNTQWQKPLSKIRSYVFNTVKYPAYKLTDEAQYKELVTIIQNEDIDYIDGYTTAIYFLAKYIQNNECNLYDRKLYVITTGETLQPFQKEAIERAIGKTYDNYGCGEISGIAFQNTFCEEYIIIDTNVLVEFNKTTIADDGSMPLIITHLHNKVMPLIRYQNDDMAIPGTNLNLGKTNWSTLQKVSGRISDTIELRTGGALVVPSFFGSKLLRTIKGIQQYQVEKISTNKILINLEVTSSFTYEDRSKVISHLNEYLKDHIEWEIRYVEKIPISEAGKHKLIIDRTK